MIRRKRVASILIGDGRILATKDVKKVAREIDRIAGDKGSDSVAPRDVWMAAKNPASPLHKYFTWNLRKAAEKTWNAEARALIGAVRYHIVTFDGFVGTPHKYTSIRERQSEDERPVSVYAPTERVLENPFLRSQKLREHYSSLMQWCARVCEYEETAGDRKKIATIVEAARVRLRLPNLTKTTSKAVATSSGAPRASRKAG